MNSRTGNITTKFHKINYKRLLRNLQNMAGDYFFLPHPVLLRGGEGREGGTRPVCLLVLTILATGLNFGLLY